MSDELKIASWPSTPDEHRWHRFLEAARKKWGYEQVSAAKVYEAFDGRVAADFPEFAPLATSEQSMPTSRSSWGSDPYLLARFGRADEARLQLEAWKGESSMSAPYAKWKKRLEDVIAESDA